MDELIKNLDEQSKIKMPYDVESYPYWRVIPYVDVQTFPVSDSLYLYFSDAGESIAMSETSKCQAVFKDNGVTKHAGYGYVNLPRGRVAVYKKDGDARHLLAIVEKSDGSMCS